MDETHGKRKKGLYGKYFYVLYLLNTDISTRYQNRISTPHNTTDGKLKNLDKSNIIMVTIPCLCNTHPSATL